MIKDFFNFIFFVVINNECRLLVRMLRTVVTLQLRRLEYHVKTGVPSREVQGVCNRGNLFHDTVRSNPAGSKFPRKMIR